MAYSYVHHTCMNASDYLYVIMMEYNHANHTCMNASDCGGLYTGRDWTDVRFLYVYKRHFYLNV